MQENRAKALFVECLSSIETENDSNVGNKNLKSNTRNINNETKRSFVPLRSISTTTTSSKQQQQQRGKRSLDPDLSPYMPNMPPPLQQTSKEIKSDFNDLIRTHQV